MVSVLNDGDYHVKAKSPNESDQLFIQQYIIFFSLIKKIIINEYTKYNKKKYL